ncbi:hypothetical protein HDV03_000808 [Kappamyces sp. JEL0829]|nr:hypothetical protein HDV03_000808 [Kappamyces sp. JEL0829]
MYEFVGALAGRALMKEGQINNEGSDALVTPGLTGATLGFVVMQFTAWYTKEDIMTYIYTFVKYTAFWFLASIVLGVLTVILTLNTWKRDFNTRTSAWPAGPHLHPVFQAVRELAAGFGGVFIPVVPEVLQIYSQVDPYRIAATIAALFVVLVVQGVMEDRSAFLNFDDRYAPAVEEPEDINALSRTIGLLGLDDSISPAEHNVTSEFQPYSERRRPELARPRSISVSFPAISPDVDAYTQSPFGRTISSMAIMTETPAGMVPRAHSPEQVKSWQEMAETFQSKSGIPSQTSPALSQSGLDRSNSINNDINSPEVSSPSRSIWIGNLDTNLGSDDLGSIFVRFGAIESVRVLPEKECAFVNYVRLEDALDAKEQMQGARLGNCVVRIGFGKTDAIQDTQTMQPTKSLYVRLISKTHKNCGFVNFVSLEDAISARQQLNGQDLGGSVLKINFAKVPPKPDPPLTPAQALANPGVLSKLVAGAVERSANAWQKDQCVGNKQSRKDFAGAHMYADSEASSFFASDLQDDILSIPEIIPSRKHDQSRLRELRKKLEGNVSPKDFDAIFIEIIDDADDLCSDYIGNVIIQKIMEKASDPQRLQLIEKVSHLMAALGIHKNGTWAVQKIIDLAKSISHIDAIVAALTPYAPALLLDQFGNYVVQCCLRLGSTRNQFIFDAISSKICQVGQGRFGARATKACLDSSYTTKRQQKQVSLAIVQNCVQLSMNSNGSILLTWLMDVSVLPGRYRVLAPIMIPHLQMLACHKLASVSLLKIGRRALLTA